MKKNSNRTLTGFLLFAIVLTFTILVVNGIIEILGINNLSALGKIIIGTGVVIGISYFAKKYLKINL